MPSSAGAEESPPSVGGENPEQLSIAVPWGLYEHLEAKTVDGIGVVAAPMPFGMQLRDSGEHRLFLFVQHRGSELPYCAESPAATANISVELTDSAGDPVNPGSAYTKTYVWTPTEPGEYALCAYLDASADEQPVAKNFLTLSADPAPGQLSIFGAPEGENPERRSADVQGQAVVPSEVTASMQAPGLPCTLPEGGLAGQQLTESPAGAVAASGPRVVGPGAFTVPYVLRAPTPGIYEVCAYMTPASTTAMDYWRPYEVASADVFVPQAQAELTSLQATTPILEAPPAPTLSRVSLSNPRFRAGSDSAQVARRTPIGTTFRFALSERATVKIAISRVQAGVIRGRSCARMTSAAHRAQARGCTIDAAVGTLLDRGASEGDGAIPFSGSFGRRRLAAGSYLATVVARNANGRSRSLELRFSVAP